MEKIRFLDADDTSFVRVLEMMEAGGSANPSKVSMEEKLGQAVRQIFPGGPSQLQLFAVRCEPNCRGQIHAHAVDEIMYVVEGDMVFGARSYGAGSAVYIPGETLYSFRSGPNGCTFLNFRGSADQTYLTRDDWAARRGGDERASGDGT